jgi:hypothetical protein
LRPSPKTAFVSSNDLKIATASALTPNARPFFLGFIMARA